MFGHGQFYPTHKLSQQKMKKRGHAFQKAFEVSCHMTEMTQHPPMHHPKTLILGFFWMGQNPTPKSYWVFFFLCHLTPNGQSFLLPSYVPTPSYLPPFPLTLPSFTINIMLSPLPPLWNIAITYVPFPSFILPLVAKSCIVNNYVVTSSKKLHC
jgi:hypothetical protein